MRGALLAFPKLVPRHHAKIVVAAVDMVVAADTAAVVDMAAAAAAVALEDAVPLAADSAVLVFKNKSLLQEKRG